MPIFGKSKKKTDGAKAEAKAKLQIQRLENEAAAEQRLSEAELQRIRMFQSSGNKKAALSAAQRYKEHMDTMNSLLNQANTLRKGIKAKKTADRGVGIVDSLEGLNIATKTSIKRADLSKTTAAISDLATNVETVDMVGEILEGDVLTDEPTEEEEQQLDDIIAMAMGSPASTDTQTTTSPQTEDLGPINLPRIPRDQEIPGSHKKVDDEERKKLLEKLAKKKEELKGDQ